MADVVFQELDINNGGRIVFDRSRVRILLCDPSTSPDVVDLLRRCSYQVIAVQNARQVMEVLRTRMAQVDLILAEVELPNKRGFKMLKYIMKEEHLKKIPIVMMSSRDEVSVVGKCLRLGAADYLVKPLRTNELLNLWTHMWRRRRMLGMTEKHLIGSLNANDAYFDIPFGDTSESNTTSTDLFSDESNEQARRSVMDGANSRLAISSDQARRDVMDDANIKLGTVSTDVCSPNHGCDSAEEGLVNTSSTCTNPPESASQPLLELTLKRSSDVTTVEPKHSTRSEQGPSLPKKTELKIGESSAFLSYTKFCNRELVRTIDKQSAFSQATDAHEQQSLVQAQRTRPFWQSERCSDPQDCVPEKSHSAARNIPSLELCMEHPSAHWESVNNGGQGSNLNVSVGAESLPSSQGPVCNAASEQSRPRFSQLPAEQIPMVRMHIQNENLMGVPTIPSFAPSHHVAHHLMAPNLHPSALLAPSLHLYHGLEAPLGLGPGMPTMHTLPPGPFSYYPLSLAMGQHAQIWPQLPTIPISDHKIEKAERREAALSKFRQKRKDRCFEKKIRYVSRKRLAEQRPRNRGQFVRRSNGSEACGGGGGGGDESEEEEDYDNGPMDTTMGFSVNRVPACSRR